MLFLFVLIGTVVLHADWYEGFESYEVAQKNWCQILGVPWQSISEREAAVKTVSSQSGVTTKALCFQPWRYNVWHCRPLTGFDPEVAPKFVTLTANVMIPKHLHEVWPFANHVAIGNVAIGISGGRITYGRVTRSHTTRKQGALPITSFTKVGEHISPDTWYEVKIEYRHISGVNNDLATLSYRMLGDQKWNLVKSDFQAEADLENDPTVYLIGDTGPPRYMGCIDKVYAKYSKVIKLNKK
jgi:hypothetical protein